MSNYLENVKKYVDSPNEDAVDSLVGFLGISLKSRDAALVAASDADELAKIRNGYCSKNLDLDDEAAQQAMDKVCAIMKGDKAKCRVVFYYLLAQESDTMNRLC